MAAKPVVIPIWGGNHVHRVSPAAAQVRQTGCADETVAAFTRFITDGDLAKRASRIVAPRLGASPMSAGGQLPPCQQGLADGECNTVLGH
jgi:hypothetical protein